VGALDYRRWPAGCRVAADGAVRPGSPGDVVRVRGFAKAGRFGLLRRGCAGPRGLRALAFVAVLASALLG